MGLFGPPNVDKLRARRNVEGLIKALHYRDDSQVRQKAAYALGELGDARAVDPLIEALKGWDGDVRKAATEALGKMGTAAFASLSTALDYWDSSVRAAAAIALGQIGDPRSINLLIPALRDKVSSDLRLAAAGALDNLGWQPAKDETGAAYWIARREWNACALVGPPAVEQLLALLKDKSVVERLGATSALGLIGDPRAYKPLIDLLTDANKEVSAAAKEALVRIGVPVIEPLITALANYGWATADVLQQIFKQLGDETLRSQVLVALIAALKNRSTQAAAAVALGETGDLRAVEPLIAALGSKEWTVRNAAADALAQIGDVRAVVPLMAALTDKNGYVREVHESAAAALGQLGDPRAVTALIDMLGKDQYSERLAAAQALVRLYKSGRLDKPNQELILAQRTRMAVEHSDQTEAKTVHPSDCHSDIPGHTDNNGIGVWFEV